MTTPPSIEITRDPFLEILDGSTCLRPHIHSLLADPPWLVGIRDQLPAHCRSGLLCVHNHLTGADVLCQRILHPSIPRCHTIVDELEGYEPGCSWGGWPKGLLTRSVLVPRLIPIEDEWARLLAHRRASKRAQETAMDDAVRERSDVASHLRHQGLSDAAHSLETGAGSWVSPSQNQDQVGEYLDMFKTLNRITP